MAVHGQSSRIFTNGKIFIVEIKNTKWESLLGEDPSSTDMGAIVL